MRNIKTSCKLAALILSIIMLTGCGAAQPGSPAGSAQEGGALSAAEEEKHQKQVFAMDTVMMLTAYGSAGEAALEAAQARIYALEADLDPESDTGSVHALNAGAGSQVVVSEDCFKVMSTAMDCWLASGGALDPGMYPLSKAWGFIGGDYRVPSGEEIGALLAAKNTGAVMLDEAACAATVPVGTALFVMGKDGALSFYDERGGFELVLITKDNEVIITPGLADLFTESGGGYSYHAYTR